VRRVLARANTKQDLRVRQQNLQHEAHRKCTLLAHFGGLGHRTFVLLKVRHLQNVGAVSKPNSKILTLPVLECWVLEGSLTPTLLSADERLFLKHEQERATAKDQVHDTGHRIARLVAKPVAEDARHGEDYQGDATEETSCGQVARVHYVLAQIERLAQLETVAAHSEQAGAVKVLSRDHHKTAEVEHKDNGRDPGAQENWPTSRHVGPISEAIHHKQCGGERRQQGR